MSRTFTITGTDTGIGKTAVSAMLMLALDALYWKPIQSGTEEGTDSLTVKALTGLPDERFLPEQYILSQPLSPHRAAELDDIEIDIQSIKLPLADKNIIVEGAGGLLVPVTRQKLQIDLFAAWKAPVILCARTGLGTLNHTLLSVEALHHRTMLLHGIIFIGEDNPDNIRTIGDFSGAKILGRLPHLPALNRAALANAFAQNFRKEDFQ
ncbi:MAG: dethiobiotin synthase [Alphaproteobacteria bacterium]|nr:dethiobiotin synthase [Alphaproteobacteria bacterium]